MEYRRAREGRPKVMRTRLGHKVQTVSTLLLLKLEEVGVDDEMRTLEESHTVKTTKVMTTTETS